MNYFQTQAAVFISLPSLLEKDEKVLKKSISHKSIETK